MAFNFKFFASKASIIPLSIEFDHILGIYIQKIYLIHWICY